MSQGFDEQPHDGPVIRDKRRIDPETGQVRERPEVAAPAEAAPRTADAASGTRGPDADQADLQAQLAERTADLQRLQAEYVNYKRRVDRERENARQGAIASTLGALLPVLDDIDRAREHGELTGGFKAVADSLLRAVAQSGMTPFGAVGDTFDPRIHEALMHSYSDDVEGPVCAAILQVGYQLGERVVRPARVAVTEPSGDAAVGAPGRDDADSLDPDSSDAGSLDVESSESADHE